MMNDKHKAKLAKMIEEIEAVYALDPSLAMQIVSTAKDSAHRMMRRKAAIGDMERVEFAGDNQPTTCFNGRCLYRNEKEGYSTEFWTTDGDQWVVLIEKPDFARAYTFLGDDRNANLVMAALGWTQTARTLAKAMGWSLHREID